jgi:hypothetical protein
MKRRTVTLSSLLRENPRLKLLGDNTSDGAVFWVQHLFCFLEGTQVWARTPTRSVQVCKRPGRGHSVSNQFREARRGPQSANALRDIFLISLQGDLGVS